MTRQGSPASLFLLVLSVCLLISLLFGLNPTAQAKGNSALKRVTLSDGHFRVPHEVIIQLPDSYDEMVELPALGTGEHLPFAVELHYEFPNGEVAAWAGRFDGNDHFYFPQALVIGSGTWEPAGWYRANPLLADVLRAATAPAVQLPATGDQAALGALIVLSFGTILAGMWARWSGKAHEN